MVLKVMAGDKINAKVQAWYPPSVTDNTVYSGAPLLVNNLISALSSGLLGAGSKGTLGELSNTSGVLNNPLTSFLSDPDRSYTSGKPKAYLNWILLDEQQFKYVDINNNSGAVQIPAIGGSEQKKLLQANGGADITIAKNGYIYVFVSNESQGAVYFDDLRVEHTAGAILEETHYYPFGLTMAGISSKAALTLDNKLKYNGKEEQKCEFSNGSGLEWLDYGARMYDNQLGKWHVQDVKADKYNWATPYAYCLNNPVVYIDPDGNDIIVAFTGGPTGGGKTVDAASKDASIAGRVILEAQKVAEANGVEFSGRVITPGVTSASSVKNALSFIKENYTKGEKVILYGYSYGGDFAVELAEALKEENIAVDLLITVDASDGPAQNVTVNDVIPDNVKNAVNFFQTDNSGKSSGSHHSGSSASGGSKKSSSSNKKRSGSDSGSSDSPGSRGGEKKAANSNKTFVRNYKMVGPTVNHGNIDEKTESLVNWLIEVMIQNRSQ